MRTRTTRILLFAALALSLALALLLPVFANNGDYGLSTGGGPAGGGGVVAEATNTNTPSGPTATPTATPECPANYTWRYSVAAGAYACIHVSEQNQ